MKTLVISFLIYSLTYSVTLHAQLLSPTDRPVQSAEMPEWARYMYAATVNVRELDSAYEAYYKAHAYVKNNYTKYYRRFRSAVEPFVQNDGTIREITHDDVFGKEVKSANSLQSPQAVTWKPLGPLETYAPASGANPPQLLPWQSNVYAFDISPTNPSIIYAVTEPGGFFKTTNKGVSWTMLEPGVASSAEAVAVHPSNPDIVYVGVYGSMIRTTDGGQSWKPVWSLPQLYIYDIEVRADNPNIIYVATFQGFYRSIDGGANWTQSIDNPCDELETNAANKNEVYILRKNYTLNNYEFWKSVDGGVTFKIKTNGWLNTVINPGGGRMTVTPADSKRIYAVLLGDSTNPYIMRSDDAGESWRIAARGNTDSLKMNNGQGYYDLSIACSPSNADLLMVGTTTAFRSTDGGYTFKQTIGGYYGDFPIHPDIQEMKCLGGDSYIATDGGFNYSDDFFGVHSEPRTIGINASDFWGFSSGWNEDVMVGGRYHNGNTAWHENYGTKYFRMGGGETATGYVNPIENRKVYFSDLGGYDLPKSFDEKPNYFSVGKFPNESYYRMEYSEMEWDPRCYNTVWIGKDNTMWRSTNGALSYDSVWSSADNGAVLQHIKISRSNPDVMYVSQRSNALVDGKIWRTTDAGKTWSALPPFPNTSGAERRVMQIAVSGSDDKVIFAALLTGGKSNKIFKSRDGGNTWQNLTSKLIENTTITDLIHQLGTNDGVYIACYNGVVYYRNASMNEWSKHGDGLPYALYTRALKPFYRDNKVRTGSNLGIWEAPLYEHSKPLAQPCVDKRSTACERDTFYFDDYSALERANAKWHWSFPGASWVSDSTARNPKVLYASKGSYAVTLAISNDYGTDVKTVNDCISIQTSECNVDAFADKALDLGGKSDLATIPVITSMRGASGLTVSTWLKLDTIQQSFSQILSNWASDVGFSFGFSFQDKANTNLTFYWKNVPYQLTSPFNLPVDEWVHVAITVAPGVVTLYTNGNKWEYKNASADFSTFDLASTPWEIGGGLPGQGGNYRGQMEELQIFKRALDSNEIRTRMHLVNYYRIYPDSMAYPEPVAYYQFNESTPQRFLNRYGTVHAKNGGGTFVTSTAPVARGTSGYAELQGGNFDFGATGVSLIPGDDFLRHVFVSRLESNPDSIPTSISSLTPEYWIIHSFNNSQLFKVDSLIFARIGAMSQSDVSLPSTFKLFRRKANEHLNMWRQSDVGVYADSVLQRVSFGSDTNAVGQYIIGTSGSSLLDVPASSEFSSATLHIIPNPTSDVATVFIATELPATLRVLNAVGVVMNEFTATSPVMVVNTAIYADGVYFVQLSGCSSQSVAKMMVVR